MSELMTDKLSKTQRSLNMSKIGSSGTKPELQVRKFLFKAGFRFRVNYKIPGKPDIALPSRKIAMFVNGCFWHQHNCKKAALPATNTEFWTAKLLANKKRDKNNEKKLISIGWKPIKIWECKLNNKTKFKTRMDQLLTEIAS